MVLLLSLALPLRVQLVIMKAIQHILTAGVLLATLASGQGQPIITNQPLSITNLAGTIAAFWVGAEGTPPLAYQWCYGGCGFPVSLGGDTNASLSLTNVQAINTAGSYWVVVTDYEGAVTSAVATLTVLTPPKIVVQPANQTTSLFANTTFRVSASGDPPLSYQWRLGSADLAGMTNATLTVTNTQRVNAGGYDVVVTNLSGCVTSQVATLTIVPFNSIYCFGFSWTDTHNCTWDPTMYWHNRASNGPLWPEYLSTNLGLAYVQANNYAHCGAAATDTENQVISFPAPSKPELSAYFLWLGFDINVTDPESTWTHTIQTDITINSNAIARLYSKGAREIIVESQFGEGEAPLTAGWYGTNTALFSRYHQTDARLNAGFMDAMNALSKSKPDLRLVFVDMFSKFDDVLADPIRYGFTKSNIDALDDPSLTNKAFTGPGADYVWWNPVHATTKFHELLTGWHLEAMTNSVPETTEAKIVGGSLSVQMNHLLIGRDYTLQGSPDLTHWNDIQSFTATAGTNQWTGGPGAASAGFYRLKWHP